MTSTTEASEVSLTSEIKVLDSGGTAVRAACGRMTRRRVVAYPMPMVSAASHWPLGTDRIAERITSAA